MLTGVTGVTGDNSEYIIEDNDKDDIGYDNSNINKNCNCQDPPDPRIGLNHPFYYCIDHPKFQNVNLEVIENHLILAKDHKIENEGYKENLNI
jgi:hypothetical protein